MHLPSTPGPQTLPFVSLPHSGSHPVETEQLQDGRSLGPASALGEELPAHRDTCA